MYGEAADYDDQTHHAAPAGDGGTPSPSAWHQSASPFAPHEVDPFKLFESMFGAAGHFAAFDAIFEAPFEPWRNPHRAGPFGHAQAHYHNPRPSHERAAPYGGAPPPPRRRIPVREVYRGPSTMEHQAEMMAPAWSPFHAMESMMSRMGSMMNSAMPQGAAGVSVQTHTVIKNGVRTTETVRTVRHPDGRVETQRDSSSGLAAPHTGYLRQPAGQDMLSWKW